MSVLPSRSSVEGMTKEEIAAACHTTLVHVFTGILIANNLLEERGDGLYAFTESAVVDEGDAVEVEEMAEVAEDIAEETPLSVQDMFQVPRLHMVEEESDPDSSQEEQSIQYDSTLIDEPPIIEKTKEPRRIQTGFTRQDHELMIQHSLTLDPRFLIIMDAENIAMNHGCHLFFSVRGIQLVREYFEKRGHKVVGFVPEYCMDERNWSERWEAVKKKLKTGSVDEDHFDRSSSTPYDMEALKRLKREGVLSLSPSKDYSDSYAIEYAKTKNGIIITNDRFNDAINKIKDVKLKRITQRWLRTYVISYSFVGDDFIPNPDYEPPEYYEINTE